MANNILQRIANISSNQTVSVNDLYVSQIRSLRKVDLDSVDLPIFRIL